MIRLRRDGRTLPEAEHAPAVRGWLWIVPGCLIEGRGPVYRSLDAYLMVEARRPQPDEQAFLGRLGDTRTRIDEGVLMVYGEETSRLGGGGLHSTGQVWACRPLS